VELGELLVQSDWAAAMEYLKTVSFSIGRLVLGLIFICLADTCSCVVLYKLLWPLPILSNQKMDIIQHN
jgi:hypothetical protein